MIRILDSSVEYAKAAVSEFGLTAASLEGELPMEPLQGPSREARAKKAARSHAVREEALQEYGTPKRARRIRSPPFGGSASI